MNQPVCIYLDSEIATRAAAVARKNGAAAKIKVESLTPPAQGDLVSLFIVESESNDRQKIIDSIAEAGSLHPRLTSQILRCPICDSIQVEYPEHPNRSPVLHGLGRVMDWVARLSGLSDNASFRCRKCSHVWRPEVSDHSDIARAA